MIRRRRPDLAARAERAERELARLRAATEGDPLSVYHEVAKLREENDRLRSVETTAACVVDVYSGHGGHVRGLRGAMGDLADALAEAGR